MVSAQATSLREAMEQKLHELGEALDGLDEEKAAQRPAEAEWCCKEVLSHLMGDEGEDAVAPFRRFVDEDTPMIGIVTGLPYYTPARQAMSLKEIRAAVWQRYQGVADFLGGLSDEQLERKARVPLFKDTPAGEYPTVVQFVGGLNFHLTDHINQLRAARQAISA